MKIKQIFEKPIGRYIEGVIKADDLEHILVEVEEYEITNEVEKALSEFLEAYTDYQGANGVWISGFFGSGKSHLLKMLALLVENREFNGEHTLDYFLNKCKDNALLKGSMQKVSKIPSKSILFNIDQKADAITQNESDRLLAVFVKVFNEACGYYGNQGYIAQFERDLDKKGLYEEFKSAYKKITSTGWVEGRESFLLENEIITKTYAEITNQDVKSLGNLVESYRNEYKLSIEDFAEMVRDYVEKQQQGFRINFFVDEVGQYIAEDVRLMTNLQTIAESLATKCKGQSWIIVTAQENMDSILGEMSKQQSTDFSKIQARFKTRMKLTSKNVDEVIQARLLSKNQDSKQVVADLYSQWKNNFGTLFDFADGATKYQNYRDEKHFINCYPFVPYQFTVFQKAIIGLSEHDDFEGRHRSVGERSMLGVFQEVAKLIAEQNLGYLAPFDLMFEGIRSALRTQIQQAVINAENHLKNPIAVRILKTLLLVKYIQGFNATPRNLRVLLQTKLDENLTALEKEIRKALDELEGETYIQRNGEVYEYLTDDEKDVEKEIKDTAVDQDEIAKTIEDLFFTGIIRENKMAFESTNQDFSFTRKVDERNLSKEQELSIHLVTPFYEHANDIDILKAHGLGKPELLIVLPNDTRFTRDIMFYKQADKYIRIHSAQVKKESVQMIISNKAIQRDDRYRQLQIQAQELVRNAKIIVSGEEATISNHEPKPRILKGFELLITKVYPNLRMLYGRIYREEDIDRYLEITKGSLLGSDALALSEAEGEMLSIIQGNKRAGTRTTIKNLVDTLSKRPYGWDLSAIQCNLALLTGKSKIEARSDANILEGSDFSRALKNTHGFPNVILEPQAEFSNSQIRKLKDFFSDFFDRPVATDEAKLLANETRQAFQDLHQQLREYYAQIRAYPFMSAVEEPINLIDKVLEQSYTYYLEEFNELHDQLFKYKDNVIDPIRRFMSSANKDIYDQANRFIQEQGINFDALENGRQKKLKELLAAQDCFKNNTMNEVKKLVEQLREEIQFRIKEVHHSAMAKISEIKIQVQNQPEYAQLKPEQKTELDASFESIKYDIRNQQAIPVIRDKVAYYEVDGRKEMLQKILAWVQPDTIQAVEIVTIQDLNLPFSKGYLTDEKDVDDYLKLLRDALSQAVKANKRIQL